MIKVEFKINFSKLLEYIKFPRVNIAQERKSKKSILLHSTHYGQTYDTQHSMIFIVKLRLLHIYKQFLRNFISRIQECKELRIILLRIKDCELPATVTQFVLDDIEDQERRSKRIIEIIETRTSMLIIR